MNCIAVVDKHFGIGKDNDLLFRLPLDLKHFKELTLGKIVVMGANTFASLPSGALPNRTNIVLDHTNSTHLGATTVDSVEKLFAELKKYPSDDIFVIGGATVYKLLLDFCHTAFITKVNADGNADLFFPNLDKNPNWKQTSTSQPIVDNNFETTYCVYKKTN